MKLTVLEANNFRSYNHFKLDFTNPLGLVNVTGSYVEKPVSNGSGKAQPYSERIMTPTGITTIGKLKVGDLVYNRFGKAERVTHIFEKGKLNVYKVTTSDGREILVNKDHLFTVYNSRGELNETLSLESMITTGLWKDNSYKPGSKIYRYALPINEAIEYPTAKINYDPYTVGALLGDGCLTGEHIQISADDKKKFVLGKIVANNPCLSGYRRNSEKNYTWAFILNGQQSSYKGTKHKHYLAQNEDICLPSEVIQYTKNKSIPNELIHGSIKQRYELINGLFDTDGSARLVKSRSNISSITFSSVNKVLIDQVTEILRSLGYLVFVTKEDRRGKKHADNNYVYKSIEYTLKVKSTWEKECKLFTIPDKLNKVKSSKKTRFKHTDRVKIVSVEKLGYQENMRCIMVDDDEHLYVSGDYVVSHNTTLFFAIPYAFYGQLPDGSKGDDVVKQDAGKDCWVSLGFVQYGHTYRIVRYRKDLEHKNKVLLYQDDSDVTLSTNKETDNKILDIIGISFDTFLNSIMFSPEKVNSFISGTDKNRKEILEELTNTNIYKQAESLVKDDYKSLSSDTQVLQSQLDKLEVVRSYNESAEQSYNKAVNFWNNQCNNLKKSIVQYSKTEKPVYDLESMKTAYEQAKLELDGLPNVSYTEELDELKNAKYKFMDYKKQYEQVYEDSKRIYDQYNQVKNADSPVCATCGSKLDDKHREIELSNLTNSLISNKQTLDSLKSSLIEWKQRYQKANSAYQDKYNEYNKLADKRKELAQYYTEVYTQYSQAQQAYNKYLQDQQLLNKAQKDYEAVIAQKPSKPKLEQFNHDNYDKLSKQIADNTDKLNKLSDLKKVYSDKGVKAQALSLVIPYINTKLDQYLRMLTDNTMTAHLTSTTVTKSGKSNAQIGLVIDSSTSGDDYHELSSGEKRKIGISLNLAFMTYLKSQIGGLNIAIFDELFENLDDMGVDSVVSLLVSLKDDIGSLFVISHSDELKYNSNFNHHLIVQKDDTTSKVSLD